MRLKNLTDENIHTRLKHLTHTERKITAEILEYIVEIRRRQLYLAMGYDSILSYLIQEMGCSKTAALRRMDAARLLSEFPELKEKFASGALNLSQASLFAQGLRQKKAEERKIVEAANRNGKTAPVPQSDLFALISLPQIANRKSNLLKPRLQFFSLH